MADVTFLCKRTLVSTKPVQPGQYYSFSKLDHIMEYHHLRLLFYYNTRAKMEFGKATAKLRESFSETLTYFPLVTGRLQRTPEGCWMVKYNDAGVRTVEARAKGSVEEWLQTAGREQELKLIHWEDIFHKPYYWSTFYIQLTEFEGGGIAIGLSCSHLLADATSATMLVKAWADTTLLGKMVTPPRFRPFPPRMIVNKDINHKPYTDLINYYRSSLESAHQSVISCTGRYATVTFAFTDEMVKKCMTEASTDNTVVVDSSSSPFASLASVFWLSISKVKGKREGLVDMLMCLDGRKALGLDERCFGNCMIFNKVSGEDVKEVGLMQASMAVKDVIEKMGSEGVTDLVDWLESKRSEETTSLHINNGSDLLVANWESLDPYSATFQSQVKPARVSYYFEPVSGAGQVLILPSRDEGSDSRLSRVVMVTLPEEEAVRLCEEALILGLSPTILMGMNKNIG